MQNNYQLKLTTVIIFLCMQVVLYAQGDITTEHKTITRNEKSGYLQLNSNGWGFGYTQGKMKSIYRKNLYTVEFSVINHKKEVKINNPLNPEGRRFVFGKKNEFYTLRLSYGNLLTRYFKRDKGGIEVRYIYNVGANLGFLKPVYYEIGNEFTGITVEKYNSSIHNYLQINGKASYFKGINETTVVPGIFLKAGASFEFSSKDIIINAIDCGLILDVYPKEIEIMAGNNNNFYFVSLFVAYRFGRIINPRVKNIKPVENI